MGESAGLGIVAEPEIVIGIVGRDTLSILLTALHRGGYGHVTRVLDPVRAEVTGQLRRAGAAVPAGFGPVGNDQVAVMVSAPARTGAAAEVVRRAGAATVWETERTATQSPVFVGPVTRRSRARHAATGDAAAD